MPLKLPNLDDRTWKDLTEEGRLLLPTWSPTWTNYNASDPGITLMELFAYYCESFLYRLNQISDANITAFLTLINGPDWGATGDLTTDVRDTLLDRRAIHRAVSAEDFEVLALAINDELGPNAKVRLARVKCIPRRNVERSGPAGSNDAPGHVSILIVPDPLTADARPLLLSLRRTLEPKRLLGTRVHLALPRYLHIGLQLSVEADANVARGMLRSSILEALQHFLDPLTGGSDGTGWPFGRNLYVSDVYELIARVPGVKSVERRSVPEGMVDELTVEPAASNRLRRNRFGELEAVALEPTELVRLNLDDCQITVTSGWEG